MGRVKTKSLKLSMTITFLITICIIAVMSALTIFAANKLQQELLKKQYLMISSPDFRIDESTGNYVFDIDKMAAFQYGRCGSLLWLLCCYDRLTCSFHYDWHWSGCDNLLSKET